MNIDLESKTNEFVKANLESIRNNLKTRDKFIDLLMEYYCSYAPEDAFENYDAKLYSAKKHCLRYSGELFETANNCLEHYDAKKGEFTHLFNSEMKKAVRRAKFNSNQDKKRCGIVLQRQPKKLIRKINLFIKDEKLNQHDPNLLEILSNKFQLSITEIRQLMLADYVTRPVSLIQTNSDGDYLLDNQPSSDKGPEEQIVDNIVFFETIEKMDYIFSTVQERQKNLCAMLLTAEIIKNYDIDLYENRQVIEDKTFFNKKVLEYYQINGDVPSQKQIAKWNEVSAQSLSRSYKTIKEKLRNYVYKS